MNNQNITLYIVPEKVAYVENKHEIITWEKTDIIDSNVPTVIFLKDSIALSHGVFFIVYQNRIQAQGGSGSCYNPLSNWHNVDVMDNNNIRAHMSKWRAFNVNVVWESIVYAKSRLLRLLDKEPLMFLDSAKDFSANLYGKLAGDLDAIALGKNIEIKKATWQEKQMNRVKLLN